MAEVKKTKVEAANVEEERVPLLIPRIAKQNADQNVFIRINDNTYLIERGKTVMVPRIVKEHWDMRVAAEAFALDYADSMAPKEP